MKKTFPVNINGSIFYIDEDAYTLLNTYLDQLRKAFPGEEGKEISSDIEARIAEHFNERINAGARVIVLDDVNNVICIMGQPDQLADTDGTDNAGSTGSAPAGPTAPDGSPLPPPYPGAQPPQPAQQPPVKRLYRNERNKVFGGIFGGLSLYLGWNANVMRLLYLVLALCTYFWPCVILYLVAWMIIPPARTPRQILEMTGSPVTLGSVGQTILGTADPYTNVNGGQSGVTTVFSVIGKVIMAFLGFIAGCVGLGFIAVFLTSLCALIMYWGWGDFALLTQLDINPDIAHPILGATGVVLMSLAILTPCLALVWGACCAIFNARGASRTLIILGVILEILFIVGAVVLLRCAEIPSFSFSTLAMASGMTALSPIELA